jgi:hypothetical protein
MGQRDKNLIFNSVLKELHKEAEQQRRVMERHIRQTMSKPIQVEDVSVGTEPFNEFKTALIDEYRLSEDLKVKKKQEQADEAKFDDLKKQIRQLEMQAAVKNMVMKEMQATIRRSDIKETMTKIKETVESFFRRNFSVKKLVLGFELADMIEDLTLNEEEREKR